MLVTSRLDYCSSLFSGVSRQNMIRLQRVQNRAARIVSRSSPTDHISPLLMELHWLPCECRILFRNLVFVWRCLNSLAPSYLRDMLNIYVPSRCLRSSSDALRLSIMPSHRKIGESSFSIFASIHWNTLPFNIRNSPNLNVFKRHLKTHLFSLHLSN